MDETGDFSVRLARSKNAVRNIAFGAVNRFVCLFVPFFIRIAVIRTVGTEYLGLTSLFSSMLQVLSIAELGFSGSVVFAMYEPVARGDWNTLSAILCFFRKVYRVIGLVVLAAGMCAAPFIPRFIHGGVSSGINVYLLYFIFLFNSSLSYFLFAYKGSLLCVFQRNDVSSNINTAIQLCVSAAQLFVLFSTRNMYLYAFLIVLGTALNNILVAVCTGRLFPEVKCRGSIGENERKQITENVKFIFITRVCQITRNSFDSIFISAFAGLAVTAMYSNYYQILNAVISVIGIATASISAGVGNSIVTESKEKNWLDFQKCNFVYMWISGWATVCLLCLYQPFTAFAFGSEMLLPMKAAVLLCVYFYVLKAGDICSMYNSACGLWRYGVHLSVIEAAANIVLNYALGKIWGVCGIIAATLISLFCIGFLWKSSIVFTHYFTGKRRMYFLHNLAYALCTCAVCAATYFLCSFVRAGKWQGFAIKASICIFVPNLIYLVLYRKTRIFKVSAIWMANVLKLRNFFGRK